MGKFFIILVWFACLGTDCLMAQEQVKYEICIKFAVLNPSDFTCLGSGLEIYYEDMDSNGEKITDFNLEYMDVGDDIHFPEFTYTFPFDASKKLRRLIFKSYRSVQRYEEKPSEYGGGMSPCGDDINSTFYLPIIADAFPCNYYYLDPDNNPKPENRDYHSESGFLVGYKAHMDIYLQPAPIPLTYFDDNGVQLTGGACPLPKSKYVTLKAPVGYPASVYQWEYSIDGNTWTMFPKGQNTPELRFCGDDMADAYMQALRAGKNIKVRIKRCRYAENEQMLMLDPVLTSPQITGVTGGPTSCYGKPDGKATITFDRVLEESETLAVGINGDKYYLAPGSKVLEIKVLDAGTFPISLDGKYKNTNTDVVQPTGALGSVTIPEAPLLAVSTPVSQSVSCSGGSNGAILLTVGGGTGTLTATVGALFYTLNRGVQTRIADQKAGSYTINIKDGNGCFLKDGNNEKSWSVTVSEPAVLAPVASGTDPKGHGRTDGTILVTATGGTPPYQWTQDGRNYYGMGVNTGGFGDGTYTITAKDQAGCTATASVTLTQPKELVVSVQQTGWVKCPGQSQGELTATAQGGVGTYSYTWQEQRESNWISWGSNSYLLGNLFAGNYRVKVSDQNGNQSVYNGATVSDPAALSLSFNSASPMCYGYSDGYVTANIAGGTGTKQYSWSNGKTEATNTVLSVGTYRVTVTDANGCQVTGHTILEQPEELNVGVTITFPAVFGESSGRIGLQPSGGTPPYSYLWENGTRGSELANIPARSTPYRVTVSDGHNCTKSVESVILEPVTAEISVKDSVSCKGDKDGSLIAYAKGGDGGPYNYVWYRVVDGKEQKLSGSGSVLTGTEAGTYRVKIADRSGHNGFSGDFIFNDPDLLVANFTEQWPACKGDSDGWVKVQPGGGTSPYTWQWGDGSLSAKIENLPTDSYTVSIIDKRGCRATGVHILKEPELLTVTDDITLPSAYDATDGKITLYPTGGTTPYRYALGDGNPVQNPLMNVAANDTAYRVVVTDANQCEAEHFVRVIYPITAEIGVQDSISCWKRSDGVLAAGVVGGVGKEYSYEWYRLADNGIFRKLNRTERELSAITSGTYRVKATDREGNAVNSPDLFFGQPDTLTIAFRHRFPACNGYDDGWSEAVPSGGTMPYSYCWQKEDLPAAPKIVNIPRGEYGVKVVDVRGCEAERTDSVGEPDLLVVADTIILPSAHDRADGKITLYPSGGTSPYRYAWDFRQATVNPLTGVPANDTAYRVKITDAQGCEEVVFSRVIYPITAVVDVKDSISCWGREDGVLRTHVVGGVGKCYSYAWFREDGDDLFDLHTDDTLLRAVAAGVYRMTATDREGNSTTVSGFAFGQPDSLQINFTHEMPACHGYSDGWVEAAGVGGTAPYRYSWQMTGDPSGRRVVGIPEGGYEVKITDTRQCALMKRFKLEQPDSLIIKRTIILPSVYGGGDGEISVRPVGGTAPYRYVWKNGYGTSDRVTGLAADAEPLQVTVTDDHDCRAEAYPRMVNPVDVRITVEKTINCSGFSDGCLAAHARGGVGAPYIYSWYKVDEEIRIPDRQDSLLNGVAVGIYRLTVTDSENNEMITPDFYLGSPDSLNIAFETQNVSCKYGSDGWAEVHPSGGTRPYRYEWQHDVYTIKADRLKEGIYSVKLTDGRGCFTRNKVLITSPDELQISARYIEPLAYGYRDASVWVESIGGTEPYRYEWQGRPDVADSLSGMPAGRYTVTVTDAHQCLNGVTVVIPEPPLLQVTLFCDRPISCAGMSDGQLSAVSEGGIAPHRYMWYRIMSDSLTEFSSGRIAGDIPGGTYQVRVTDANGIHAWSEKYDYESPDPLSLTVRTNTITCNGGTDGWAEADVGGGTIPYGYQWSTNETTKQIRGLTDARYLILVTDAHGCEVKGIGEVTVPEGLSASPKVIHPVCYGENNGVIRLNIQGGITPYQYDWSCGDRSDAIEGKVAGNYAVKVTDANGCFKKFEYNLDNPVAVTVDLGDSRVILCRGQRLEPDVRIDDPQATYEWFRNGQFFSSEAAVIIGESGDFKVKVTNAKGCGAGDEVSVLYNDAEIVANFAMAATAKAGEVVKLVNTGYPVSEQVEWIIPADAEIIYSEDSYVEIVLNKKGVYTLGIRVLNGECKQELYKTIQVEEQSEDLPEVRSKEPFIKKILAWPNPSAGQFQVGIELKKESMLRLRLVTMSGVKVDERVVEGRDHYEIDYNLNLQTGLYVLQLISSEGTKSIKIIMQ